MVPPTDPWYVDLTDVNPYDLDLAKQLLADAGYPDGFTFTLDTPSYDPHPAVAEFLQSQLAEIGVTVEINTISADEWYTKVFQDLDYDATLQEHVNDRDVVWYGNPDFYWGYDNADVQQWVSEAEQADDDRRADRAAEEGQRADRGGCGERLAVPLPADRRRLERRQRLRCERPELAVLRLRHRQVLIDGGCRDAERPGIRRSP